MRGCLAWLGGALLVASALVGCSDGYSDSSRAVVPPAASAVENIVVSGLVTDGATGGLIETATPRALARALARAAAPTNGLTVNVYGDDADMVYDGEGNSLFDALYQKAGPISVNGGMFSFYLRVPDPANDLPLSLRVVAKAGGYTTTSATLTIDAEQLDSSAGAVNTFPLKFNLVKVELDAAEEEQIRTEVGVDVQVEELVVGTDISTETVGGQSVVTAAQDIRIVADPVVTTIDSGVAADINGDGFVTDTDTATGTGTVEVTIPADTQMIARDELGQQVELDASTLNATVTYHNPVNTASLETFPGGLDVVLDEEEKAIVDSELGGSISGSGDATITFVSGGFTSVEIADAAGNKVSEFDTPIDIAMVIPQGTFNPETGGPVAAGDVVPLWSYDTDTGKWSVQRLKDGTVKKGVVGDSNGDGIVDGSDTQKTAEGDWNLTFQTDHLSYFNVDWYGQSNCTAQFTVREKDSGEILTDAGLYFELQRLGGGWSKTSSRMAQGGVVNILRAPGEFPVLVKATSIQDDTIQWSKTFNTLCPGGNGSVSELGDIVLDFPEEVKFAPLEVQIHDRCSNDTAVTTPVPSVMVYIIAYERVSDPIKPYLSFNMTYDRFASTEGDGSITIPGLKVGKRYYVIAQNRETGTYKWDTVVVPDGGTVRQIFFDKQCEEATGSTGGSGGA